MRPIIFLTALVIGCPYMRKVSKLMASPADHIT